LDSIPDLSSSDFYLFEDMKNAIRGSKFEAYDDVIRAARNWIRQQDKAGQLFLIDAWL
jgi:hypothetical protein